MILPGSTPAPLDRDALRSVLARQGIARPVPGPDGLETVCVSLTAEGAGILSIHIGTRRVWILLKEEKTGEHLVYSGAIQNSEGIERFLKDVLAGR